jgi:hypothetical protein
MARFVTRPGCGAGLLHVRIGFCEQRIELVGAARGGKRAEHGRDGGEPMQQPT